MASGGTSASDRLLEDFKQSDAAVIAAIEEGMHDREVGTATGQLFDGVGEMRLYGVWQQSGLPTRVRMVKEATPELVHFDFSLTSTGTEVAPHVI